MHGYCGPYYSDYSRQKSVRGFTPAINALDQCCKDHDGAYYDSTQDTSVDLTLADDNFISCASSTGFVGFLCGKAVALNRFSRGNYWTNQFLYYQFPFNGNRFTVPAGETMVKSKKVTPTMRPQKQQPKPERRGKPVDIGGVQISAPSAISSVLTSQPTKTRSIPDGIVVSGKEFLGNVEGNGVATFGIGKSALIGPSFFFGGVLGQLARSYVKYRFSKLVVHYIPKVSTNLSGQVVICSSYNVTQPCLQPEAATFLQRALVSGNGVMGPVWSPMKMVVTTDGRVRYVDAFTNSDIDENIFCEIQCYSQVGTSQQVGYLWLEYECELKTNTLEPHSTSLPVFTGPGTRYTLTEPSVTVASNAVQMSQATLTAKENGTIYRAVVDIQGSAAGTGATLANVWKIGTTAFTSGITGGIGYTNDPIVGGMTIYLLVVGSLIYVYNSIEAAIGGTASGQLYTATVTSTSTSIAMDVTQVRIGSQNMDDTQ